MATEIEKDLYWKQLGNSIKEEDKIYIEVLIELDIYASGPEFTDIVNDLIVSTAQKLADEGLTIETFMDT